MVPSHFHHQSQEDIVLKESSKIEQQVQYSEVEMPTPEQARHENVHEEQDGLNKNSSENSDMCMQEIVSPFRNLGLSRGPEDRLSKLSPDNRKQVFEATQWTINPVQLKMGEVESDEEERKPYGIVDEQQEDEDPALLQSPGGPYSPCESPIKQQSGSVYRTSGSPIISPGKLKTQVSMKREQIFKQIMATQLEILENSPSKGSMIDRQLILQLKQKRLAQKSQQKPIKGEEENFSSSPSSKVASSKRGRSPEGSPESIITRIRKSMDKTRVPFQVKSTTPMNFVQV